MDNELAYKLYSFDIFDTLITRTTATPDGIFLIIQDKLLNGNYDIPNFIKNNFYLIRKSTSNFTRFQFKEYKEEITIYDIYENISNNNYLSDVQKQLLIDLEIETEIENSIPIISNINKLKELVGYGKNVVLISDMYLPSIIIRDILLNHEIIFNNIKIYVSCELEKTKSSGNMYKLVKEFEMINYTDWLHIGDNLHSDIYSANKLSINTIHFKTKLSDFELDIINSYGDDININKMIGTIKSLKLLDSNNIQKDIGISIGGPILFFYVNWIIDNAIQQSIENLYFFSRDGFILKKIADIIIKYRNICTIKTHYLYVSTYTSGFSLISINKTIPVKIFYKQISTINDLKFLFNENLNEVLHLLPNKYNSIDRIMSIEEKMELKSIIENNPLLMNMIIKKSKEFSDIFLKYLKQEINFNKTFAFVDFSGSAGTINAISKILINNGIDYKKLEMLYVSCNLLPELNNNFIKIRNFSNSNIYHGYDYFESLIRAMHGEAIGYEEKGDRIVAILDEKEVDSYRNIKYEEYIEGVIMFVRKYLEIFNLSCGGLYIFNIYSNKFYYSLEDYETLRNFVISVPNNARQKIGERYTFIKSVLYLLKFYDYRNIDLKNTSDKKLKFIYNFRLKYGSLFEFLLKIDLKSKNPYIVIFGLKISFGFGK